jgi:hypothetical protein
MIKQLRKMAPSYHWIFDRKTNRYVGSIPTGFKNIYVYPVSVLISEDDFETRWMVEYDGKHDYLSNFWLLNSFDSSL